MEGRDRVSIGVLQEQVAAGGLSIGRPTGTCQGQGRCPYGVLQEQVRGRGGAVQRGSNRSKSGTGGCP